MNVGKWCTSNLALSVPIVSGVVLLVSMLMLLRVVPAGERAIAAYKRNAYWLDSFQQLLIRLLVTPPQSIFWLICFACSQPRIETYYWFKLLAEIVRTTRGIELSTLSPSDEDLRTVGSFWKVKLLKIVALARVLFSRTKPFYRRWLDINLNRYEVVTNSNP